MKIIFSLLLIAVIIIGTISCNKSNFLDEKPDQALIIPESAEELQAVLDNNIILNGVGEGIVPSFGQIGSDDYWLTNFSTTEVGAALKEVYIWSDAYQNTNIKFYEWDFPYRGVFYSNIVIDGLTKLDRNSIGAEFYNNLKGSGLFFRAHMFYQLSQIFCPTYQETTKSLKLGIPLKLTSDINEKLVRSTIEETYLQIINDLRSASELLPVSPKQITRPSKPAAYGLLARTFLVMGKYDSALVYTNKCLELKNDIRDYNAPFTNISSSTPFAPRFSCEEIIFHSKMIESPVITIMYSTSRTRVDSNLYNSYNDNDLRKTAFFTKRAVGVNFKGSYEGDNQLFSGIATDEIYLTRAECYARIGDLEKAMNDLNKLMEKRWKSSNWIPFTASDVNDALDKILTERRKELLFRGNRWTDIRRLNINGANIVQKRIVDGREIVLSPNSKSYVFLIPKDVIGFHSDWQQNPR